MKSDTNVATYLDRENAIIGFSQEADLPDPTNLELAEPRLSDIKLTDGCVYTGQVEGDLPHGEGVIRWPNGSKKFVGHFERGYYKKGVLFLSDVAHYEGDFKDGIYHGNGKFECPDGQLVGEFNCGEFIRGRFSSMDGECYEGTYRNGVAEGYGTRTFSDGRKYVGYARRGKCHGQGWLRCPDGSSYEGRFENNRFVGNGDGIYRWPDGRYYIGEFRNGVFHGEGTVFHADGRVNCSGRYVYGALVKRYSLC